MAQAVQGRGLYTGDAELRPGCCFISCVTPGRWLHVSEPHKTNTGTTTTFIQVSTDAQPRQVLRNPRFWRKLRAGNLRGA